MFIEYGTLGLVGETKINLTQSSDVKYGSLSTFGFYSEKAELEYSSKHEDSMETKLSELVHTLTKKVRDVKWAYGRKNLTTFVGMVVKYNIV
jgi:hypothetical protein